MMAKTVLMMASIGGALAVAFGAFGAHALSARLDEKALHTWQTAVEYQFYHVLALMLVGVMKDQDKAGRLVSASAPLFAVGMVLFCGSLYGLALGGPSWLGPITPLGGLCFIAAWLCLAAAFFKRP